MSFSTLKAAAALALTSLTLAAAAVAQTISPDDYIQFDRKQAQLGQLLFYDKLLSGNQNISCGTCHHHDLNSTDGLSLGIGEGGEGLADQRHAVVPVSARIPRNAPALWNLGHEDIRVMFHDGRVEQLDSKSASFQSPAGALLPAGLNSVLAAQALFPMSSPAEMAGGTDENPLAVAFDDRIDHGWDMVADRVRAVPDYQRLFKRAFRNVNSPDDITIVEIANALAAFIGTEWQSHDSPWDDYITQDKPLPALAERGRELFFGDAGCSTCHAGPLFTDQNFYAVGVPQFGPGRPFDGDTRPRDLGRMETTKNPADAYRFRTPSLRNVALTAPYGHNGAYPTLRDMIRHMCDPLTTRSAWTPGMARLPQIEGLTGDFAVLDDSEEMARQVAFLDLTPVTMIEDDIDALEAFLNALTGKTALQRPLGRPDAVPSGLSVD